MTSDKARAQIQEWYDCGGGTEFWPGKIEAFENASQEGLDPMAKALLDIMDLHCETTSGRCSECEDSGWRVPWPCPTLKAITENVVRDDLCFRCHEYRTDLRGGLCWKCRQPKELPGVPDGRVPPVDEGSVQ